MITTRITVRKHLAEYAQGKWGEAPGEPVAFPPHTEIYVTVYNLTRRRPADCPLDRGNLEIVLPNRRKDDEMQIRKNPEVYNWISGFGCRIIDRKIEIQFWAEVHELLDENKHRHNITFLESAYTFLTQYDIESISTDGLVKNYQRWKENRRKREKRAYTRNQRKKGEK